MKMDIQAKSYPTRGEFKISRSTVRQVDIVELHLSDGQYLGRGECRPYARYKDTVESVTAQLDTIRHWISAGDVDAAYERLPPGPAKNVLDAAWLDFTAKKTGIPVWQQLGLAQPASRQTAFTLSWNDPQVMAEAAREAAAYPWLKLKIGESGLDRVLAVAKARPDAKLILDANEALTLDALPDFLAALTGLNIALIEQPLPAGHTGRLPESLFPICADEGLHTADDLTTLWEQGYRAVNVKLDKCGGLRAGVSLMREAKDMGFRVMAGCMVGSSLAMAPMMVAESLCDVIDLDGPLLLKEDITNGLKYEGPTVHPPTPDLWS
ncbi:dipeptide epimerase [Litorimonas sp. WD9-15]|uniref:dipeptide epimerase n=1 Tax=Litorimonas sp. WD9-15 TaxID=3418716 RepID=UPI003CFF2F65